jgi:hypothetical protein
MEQSLERMGQNATKIAAVFAVTLQSFKADPIIK